MQKVKEAAQRAAQFGRSAVAKAGAAGTALMVSGAALASGTGPGDAIAGELASGKAQQMVVIGAVAVLLGVLVVWAYIKRAR